MHVIEVEREKFENINTLQELFDCEELKVENKDHQIQMYRYIVYNKEFHSLGLRVLIPDLEKAYKLDVLRKLKRLSTDDVNKMLGTRIDTQGIWVVLARNSTSIYFAMVTESGVYNRARYIFKERALCMNVAKNYGTTNRDYNTKKFHYSKYLYDRKEDIGITEHTMVAVLNGLMDEMTIDELAAVYVNHKNKDHYDNRLCNLEICDVYENNLHKGIANLLIENEAFRSLDVKHAYILSKFNDKQFELYMNIVRESMKDNDSEWINNEILDELTKSA